MTAAQVPTVLPVPDGGANWIRDSWNALHALPFGKQLFSRYLGTAIPYTGSVDALVVDLRPGFARAELKDERRLRNHLDSLHAMALGNLAELTANVALAYTLPDRSRFIILGMQIRYLKKARGTITATCQCPSPLSNEKQAFELEVDLRDSLGEPVATAILSTLVGPSKP